MTRASNDDIRATMAALAAGDLDALSPEQVTRLEAHLNESPEAAERVADLTPAVEPPLPGRVAPPPRGAWARLWQRIDAAAPPPTPGRLWRLWRPLAAAAACVLAVGLWNFSRQPQEPDWPVQWAHDVEINHLELFDGATPFILAGGTEDSVAMIWVLDDQG